MSLDAGLDNEVLNYPDRSLRENYQDPLEERYDLVGDAVGKTIPTSILVISHMDQMPSSSTTTQEQCTTSGLHSGGYKPQRRSKRNEQVSKTKSRARQRRTTVVPLEIGSTGFNSNDTDTEIGFYS